MYPLFRGPNCLSRRLRHVTRQAPHPFVLPRSTLYADSYCHSTRFGHGRHSLPAVVLRVVRPDGGNGGVVCVFPAHRVELAAYHCEREAGARRAHRRDGRPAVSLRVEGLHRAEQVTVVVDATHGVDLATESRHAVSAPFRAAPEHADGRPRRRAGDARRPGDGQLFQAAAAVPVEDEACGARRRTPAERVADAAASGSGRRRAHAGRRQGTSTSCLAAANTSSSVDVSALLAANIRHLRAAGPLDCCSLIFAEGEDLLLLSRRYPS